MDKGQTMNLSFAPNVHHVRNPGTSGVLSPYSWKYGGVVRDIVHNMNIEVAENTASFVSVETNPFASKDSDEGLGLTAAHFLLPR